MPLMTYSGELYQALLEAAPDPILLVDDSGKIVLANRAAQRVFGYTPEELEGQQLELLLPERARETHVAHRRSYAAAPTTRAMGSRLALAGRRRDGSEVPLDISLSPIVLDRRYTICMVRDVTDRQALERELRELSYRDPLTGLYSRSFLDAEIERLDVGRKFPVSSFVFDVDFLKDVNDQFGHAAGDQHIRRAAALLRSWFRAEDVVARTGGDEFVVVVAPMDDAHARATEDRVRSAMGGQPALDGPVPVQMSFGRATGDAPPIRALIELADERMYQAKRARDRAPRTTRTGFDPMR